MRRAPFIAIAIAGFSAAACVDRSVTPAPSQPAVTSLIAAPVMSATATSSFILITKGKPSDRLPQDLAGMGAELTGSIPELGLTFVRSSDPDFYGKAGALAGVQAVADDPEVSWLPPTTDVAMEELGAAAGETEVTPSAFGGLETFRAVQWAPDAIHAPEAWDAGARGAGARVAILDGGIHSTHLDIAPRIDVARSRSFVPNQPFNFDQARNAQGACVLNDTFWHGTHVAGIVAAPGQNIGTVGIAPDATIIGVKVLHCGSGAFSWVIQGIVYAATPIAEGGAGANIINMSLGALVERSGRSAAHLAVAIGKATTYAYQRGVLVVAAAGNDGTDMDHTGNLIHLPSDAPHVISVSATGPLGWALGSTNLDRPASYTNFGQSAISVAGPGGDFVLPGNAVCSKPRFPSGNVLQFCWALDMVMSTCRGSGASTGTYCWAAGTSMAAPAVSGVAALIVGKYGPMSPTHLRQRLEKAADDLGKPGNDDFYGRGRINAFKAVN
jgi:subtilisin family serine protease